MPAAEDDAAADATARLLNRIEAVGLRDAEILRARLRSGGPSERLVGQVAHAERRIAARRAALPEVTYPADLPVAERRDDILAALSSSQVVVVAGETGSGKTTQLPKMCLELGRGIRGTIGHTQPRRIAARAVAERLSEELGVELGSAVGYQVRFTDRSTDRTLVKVMTDGVLLAEIQRDRLLLRYDTVIVDEAHERSLNIDFLLGYLRRLLPRRPDLSVVITSATIDPQRFADHFGGAPVVEVTGRTYPVEVRYRPPAEDVDQVQAIVEAVHELAAEPAGDVLVFLSGEREIRDTADALRRLELPRTEVLPLFGRLSAEDQHRVFRPHEGRRLVLATNVAETSLTVPGIRYVVDPGTARVSRYSARTKVQRLPIERVSRASADQRKGRCGRVADGVCIRLYDEEDFASRPPFTDPEILRTNLASVILQMAALDLGDVAAFPFVDPPDRRGIRDGVDLLGELDALRVGDDGSHQLTAVGRQLARLPVDPRLGRMVVEAAAAGCLEDVLVVVAAMSIQDPRERPSDKAQAADDLHRRFRDETSDFSSYLLLWRHVVDRQRELSSSAFRRMCRAEFLHYLRIREWQDLVGALRAAAASLGLRGARAPADPDAVHRCLLAGLLSHVGVKDGDTRDYLGARGARFAVSSGSSLAKKPPRWVMAGELVETNRMWARTAARIDPAWVEPLAGHLVVRVISEPHWDAGRGAVMAFERVTLYGVPIVTRRRIGYASVDPVASRELFIRHALVERDWDSHHRFLRENDALLADVARLEDRLRRRGLVADDAALFAFFDKRLPADVVSARHFDAWWKSERRSLPDLLTLTPTAILGSEVTDDVAVDFPDTWSAGSDPLPVSYVFEPGADDDGATVHVPLVALPALRAAAASWHLPGYRLELVTALIRGLPKAVRVPLGPAPDLARAALATMTPYAGSLETALSDAVEEIAGIGVGPEAWRVDALAAYLRVRFSVEDGSNVVVAGRDLLALQRRLAPVARRAVASATDVEQTGLTTWPGDLLPRSVPAGSVLGYPALVDEGTTVAVRVMATPEDQAHQMWRGTRRLLVLSAGSPLRTLVGRLPSAVKLALASYPGGVPALLADCLDATVDTLMREAGGPAWDAAGFTALRAAVRARVDALLLETVQEVSRLLTVVREVEAMLSTTAHPAIAPARADVRSQLDELLPPGFVTASGTDRIRDLQRYAAAMLRRLERLPTDIARDAARMADVQRLTAEWRSAGSPADVRWLLEELRVSLFAQSLGTAQPVSERRIREALQRA
ncbi:MAG TPA: ATP-dependent RNA helicase HrpA [Mycobacteriales bacterium]|nr:ATP-dependent RNA helicase HrpA [Mycobacteriales bacterium]